jgi:hypothetical protein
VRKIVAAFVAIPFIVLLYLTSLVRRQPIVASQRTSSMASRKAPATPPTSGGRRFGSGTVQVVAVVAAIAILVAGMLLGLPAKQVAGVAPPSFPPLTPQAEPQNAGATLPLDVAFQVQFTKPMNEASVENALTISPQVNVKYLWDATAQVVSLAPSPFWQPHTVYTVSVGAGASDQEGLGLVQPMVSTFESGAPTSGQIVATSMAGGKASPATAFQLTFTRPVKLATVVSRMAFTPATTVTVVGDDPTDMVSQVFTITPTTQLLSDKDYVVSFVNGGTDAAGAALDPVPALLVHTLLAPTVIKFRPVDGGITYDTNQPVSVRFTMAMDEKSTAAAFSVTVNGKAITGTRNWAEGDTVLVLSPRYAFKVGDKVVARVSTAARAAGAGGLHLAATATATFTVSKPKSTSIAYTGGVASATRPYYASEVYYMKLMNCTRTGGWVTGSGACSSVTHHTLPAQAPLRLSATISNKVSRPFAKYMADRKILNHYAYHDPQWRLCNWAGLCGSAWAENIASPTSAGRGGMIDIEIFYQNEYWCRCEHYYNIMAPFLNQAGVGVWVSHGVVRVSIDFYG